MMVMIGDNGCPMLVLEPKDIKAMQDGKLVATPVGVIIGYTPDADWVMEKLTKRGSKGVIDGFGLEEVMSESQTREPIYRDDRPPQEASGFIDYLKRRSEHDS